MEDYHFDKIMVENTMHLVSWIPFLSDVCPLVNTPKKVIWKIEHSYPSKVNEKPDVV